MLKPRKIKEFWGREGKKGGSGGGKRRKEKGKEERKKGNKRDGTGRILD